MGWGPSAPPPPDLAAAAKAEGEASRDTAIFNTNLNRADQVGPDGSVRWTMRPGADPMNPQPGDFIQTTSLSPAQQGLYNSENQIAQSFLNTGQAGLGRVADAMAQPFDQSGLPQLRSGLGTSAQAGLPVGSVGSGQVQSQLNLQGINAMPGAVDDASRRRVEEAMMSRLEPQFAEDERRSQTALLNSGIEKGTDAFGREMQRLDQAQNDARMQAVLAGGAEESRQVGLNAGLRQQGFNERALEGAFANEAGGQQFGQNLAAGQFANQAAGQQTQQQLAIDSLIAQLAGFDNQARAQGIQEQSFLRQLPLNEVNALRTGNQVNMPQFQSYYTGGAAQAPALLDATMAQGQLASQAAAQKQSGFNALLGGFAGMGSAYLGR